MKAKNYLLRIKAIDEIVEMKKERIEIYEMMEMRITSCGETVEIDNEMHLVERVQSSGSGDPLVNVVLNKLEAITVLKSEIDALIAEKEMIIKTMETLPTLEFKLLYRMYAGKVVEEKIKNRTVKTIKYLTFEEAAEEVGRSRRWATTTHGSGLAKIQKILDEREGK